MGPARAALGPALALLLAVSGTGLIAAASGRAGGASGPQPAPTSSAAAGPAAAGSDASGTDASVAGRIAVSPVIVRLELVPRRATSKGPVQVRAIVTNLSAARVPLVVLELTSTPALAPNLDSKVLRGLQPARSASATWSLCSTTAMSIRLVARATVGATVAVSAPFDLTLAASARC